MKLMMSLFALAAALVSMAHAQTPSVKLRTSADTTYIDWFQLDGQWYMFKAGGSTFTLYQQMSSTSKFSTDVGFSVNEAEISAIHDVSGDGKDDILISQPNFSLYVVCILDGQTGSIVYKWNPPDYDGFILVADVDGDGRNEIVTEGDSLVTDGVFYDYHFFTVYATSGISTGVTQKDQNIPVSVHLNQNYPNPFNPSTTISYQLPKESHVTLKIYDVLGREVKTMVDEEQPAGTYTLNMHGNGISSGVYFYRLQAGNVSVTKKLVLEK